MGHSTARRTALITGGSRGIGAATARRLARDGWDIVITYRAAAEAAAAVVAQCEQRGARAFSLQCDVADQAAIESVFDQAAAWGELYGVVSNAGIVSPALQVADYDDARVRRVFETNVVGAFNVASAAARRLSRTRGGDGGVIVNVSSRAAVLGGANEYVDYAASKAAVDALTIGLAAELAAEDVRVIGVRPGLIRTDIHAEGRLDRLAPLSPFGRAGEPDEVAALIAWALSDEASFVTGTSFDVAGGR